MARFWQAITDFSAGELAPSVYGHIDKELYQKGASYLYNFMPRKTGGLRKRPGTLFVGHTASDGVAQLFSIKITSTLSYVFEFTNNKIRFWKYVSNVNGGTLSYVSGQDATTTYATSELPAIQVAWLYPDLFIAHQNHAPARVRYAATDTFTYSALNFVTTSYTFTANTVNGSPTLTNLSLTSLPTASQSGLWLLTGTGIAANTYLTAVYPAATSSQNIAALSATMNNNATATNTGVTLTLTEQPIPFQSSGNYPRCVCTAFSRLWFANTINNPQSLWSSIVNVWDSSDPVGASAKVNMNQFEGIISSQQVMVTDASGNPTTNPPTYTSQQITQNTVDDSDGIFITLSETQSEILWITPGRDLIIGSADGESVILSTASPNSVGATVIGMTGSSAVQANQMNDGVVFVKLGSRGVCRLNWLGASNVTPPPDDMSSTSFHLFQNNPITAFDYVQSPDAILYFPRSDGSLAACIYDPGMEAKGWWQLYLANSGFITSMCVASGADRDAVVVSVTRGAYNYIEILTTPDWTDVRTAIYMDAATYAYNATPFSTISVDSSFNGATLSVVANGQYVGTAVPSGGTLTLPGGISANYASVGYGYVSQMNTMPIVAAGKYGTGLLEHKSVDHVRTRFYQSLDLQLAIKRLDGVTSGYNPPLGGYIQNKNVNVQNPTVQSNVDKIPIDSATEMDTFIVVYSSLPLPCEVTELVPEESVED